MMMNLMKRGQQVRLMMPFRSFTALNAADLSTIKREDVVSAGDTKWIGNYAKAVVASGD